MATVFSKIITGEIPSFKIAETTDFLAFLDVNPITKGHTLIIPKKEIDYYFAIDDELFLGLNVFAKFISKAIEKTVPCKKIGLAVIGLEVPHAHIHLIPVNEISDMNFSNPRIKFSDQELEELALSIRSNL